MNDFVIKHRWIILISSILIGAASVILLLHIKVDPDIRNYIPSSIRSKVATDQIEDVFGGQDLALILFSDSDILRKDNLFQIKEIDRSISRIGGVSSRISPFTVRSIRGEQGMMVVDPLIRKLPAGREEEQLKEDILRNRFAKNVVISEDMTTASITATINTSVPEKVTLGKIDSVINSFPGKATINKGGLPYIRQTLIRDVASDARFLVPMALLIMLFVLRINLRSWKSVMKPFSVVVLSTFFSLALMPLAGWKLSIISVLLPVILIAVANNYGIYLVARYEELSEQHPGASRRELTGILFKSLNMPILFSGFTTIAGILGLLTHSIIPARQVGVLAAAGVSLALLLSLVLVPSLISVGRPGKIYTGSRKTKSRISGRILTYLSGLVVSHPGRILAASAICVGAISTGIIFLRIDTNQEDYFSRNHPVKKASELINSKFGGSQTVSVMVTGDIKDPVILKAIDDLTCSLEKQEGVGNVFSISQVVREMSKAIFSITEDGYDRIPDTRDAVAQMFELYNMSGNPDDFKQLMNSENSKAHILVRLPDPETRVINRITSVINEKSKDFPAQLTVGGYAMIMTDFAHSIIRGQVSSLLFAVVTVLILLTIIFKSFTGGLIGSIPFFASIPVLFGFMGFAGIALDAATALLSSIMIGVGVDFTIQYIWCFNLQIKSGLSWPEATITAMNTIGRSIIINAISVMAGFSALVFSGFTSIRFFGYLVVISIGSCLIGALVVIPAFLMKFHPRFIGFETITIKKRKHEEDSDIIPVPATSFSGGRATA
ncbi:MAG: MMPL family transporter [Bacteroidota bacterium]|nr:MMPL family transporter [Bacteroidota bacterium]